MKLTRREFAAITTGEVIGAAGIAAYALSGCNTGNVWSQIQVWVPVGIAAFEQVVALAVPLAAPGIDAIAELVKASFAALAAAVNQYLAAPAADKATWLAKVQLIFSQLSGDLQKFLDATNTSNANPIIKVVLGLVQILLSTIAGFMSQIGPTPAPVTLRLGNETIQVAPVKRTLQQFKDAFNQECVAGGHPEAKIN